MLYALLRGILPKSDENFFAFDISVILKRQCKRTMSSIYFVWSFSKEVVSTLIFCDLITFQTDACLQPFMVCMSAPSTPQIIDVVVDNYNAEVIAWTADSRPNF